MTRVPLSPQVQLDNLPGMSLMAGKALSSARMSDAVLSQSSLMASQQLRDRDSEGEHLRHLARGAGGLGFPQERGAAPPAGCWPGPHAAAEAPTFSLCKA